MTSSPEDMPSTMPGEPLPDTGEMDAADENPYVGLTPDERTAWNVRAAALERTASIAVYGADGRLIGRRYYERPTQIIDGHELLLYRRADELPVPPKQPATGATAAAAKPEPGFVPDTSEALIGLQHALAGAADRLNGTFQPAVIEQAQEEPAAIAAPVIQGAPTAPIPALLENPSPAGGPEPSADTPPIFIPEDVATVAKAGIEQRIERLTKAGAADEDDPQVAALHGLRRWLERHDGATEP